MLFSTVVISAENCDILKRVARIEENREVSLIDGFLLEVAGCFFFWEVRCLIYSIRWKDWWRKVICIECVGNVWKVPRVIQFWVSLTKTPHVELLTCQQRTSWNWVQNDICIERLYDCVCWFDQIGFSKQILSFFGL